MVFGLAGYSGTGSKTHKEPGTRTTVQACLLTSERLNGQIFSEMMWVAHSEQRCRTHLWC